MHRFFTALAVMALFASLAFAGDVPTRNTITNVSATAQTYTVPNFGNGWLVKVQAYDASGTNDTLTVTKVVAVTSTRSMTNACTTAALVANATYSLDTAVSTDYLVPGDILRFSFGSVTGNVSITRIVSSP
jgi:hypothetical protein